MITRLARFSVVLVSVAGAALAVRLSRRSGATDAEFHASLPGDDVIPHPILEWTRATTISAVPEAIWPWLVQMGFGRGGWYTSPTFDRIVWRIENLSTTEILPEWQVLTVGDIVPDGPDYAAYFRVLAVAPKEHIVYRSIRHPFRGHPVDPSDPTALQEVETALIEGGVYLDFSWAFVLRPLDKERTRLIVRTRADYQPPLLKLAEIPLGLVDLYHLSTMFRGIKARVAATAAPPSRRTPVGVGREVSSSRRPSTAGE